MVNALQKFAQTVLIERNRKVPYFSEILRFINFFLLNAANIQNLWFMFGKLGFSL